MADARPRPQLVAALAGVLVFALALLRAFGPPEPRDFFIFRLGAELAARGENPYDVPKVRQHIAAQFPTDDAKEFVENSGYFLPPMALLTFMPFAMLPWVAAKVAWAAANGLAAYFLARVPLLFRKDTQPPPLLLWAVVPFVLVLNPLAIIVPFPVGQYSIVFVGAVAAGLLAFERGRPYLAAAVWVLPFVKPHLAIPLIPLAWYLGGWRPALLLLALVGVLNAAGATLVGGSPLFLRDYLNYLPQAREVVGYNRVEDNASILSWNRLLYACGGPLVELSAITTVAGYLVWLGALVGRWAVANTPPSRAWVLAATAVGGVLCAQVLPYESLFLLVAVPWVRDLFDGGCRVRACLAVLLIAVHAVPQTTMGDLGLRMYHPLAVALLAALVLIGPIRRIDG